MTARKGRGRERPRCARTPRQENTAPANTPKSPRQSFARTPNGNATLLCSSWQVTSEWCTLPRRALEAYSRRRSAVQTGRATHPEWLQHAHEVRGRRKRGVRTVHSIHRRPPQASRAMQRSKTYMYMYASPGLQTLCADACEDQVVHKPRSRGTCMDTRPLPGLGDAPTRCATHRKTAARARGARLVQTGHTRSAQASLLPISGPLRSARAIAPPVRRELATRNAAGPPHAAQKQRPTKLAWRSHHQASASPPLGHSE